VSIFGIRWMAVKGSWCRSGAEGGVRSISPISTRRLDGDKIIEVEIDDCLQRHSGGAVAQCFGESVEPGGIFDLQHEEFGKGSAPALRPGLAEGGTRRRSRLYDGASGAVAGLSLGVAEGLFALRFASSGHGSISVT
jgi:hypothetical protein